MEALIRVLGIDVGATKTAAALVDPGTGEVELEESIQTNPERPGVEVLEDCLDLAEHVAAGRPAGVLGLGICELVDLDGAITSEVSIAWCDLDLHGRFAHLGPLHMESDVRAAALAEARFGAASSYGSFLYVNVGSGISSCFVLDGTPLPGNRGNAILLGAGPLEVEEKGSGKAIARRFGAATALTVSRAAAAGDARAKAILRDAGAAVGEAIGFAVNLLDPALIVLGGSVALHASFFREELERAMREQIAAESTRDVPVVAAELGSRAGVIGAALAASSAVPAGML